MAIDAFGLIGNAANTIVKYNPFIKPVAEAVKLVSNPKKEVDAVSGDVVSLPDKVTTAASEGWDYAKDKIGLTPIDTVYNLATGTESVPSKLRTTVIDTASNVFDAAEDLGGTVANAAKKYWPFAVAGVVGVVALKAAAPEIVKRILN